MQSILMERSRGLARCRVCGFAEVRRDEVALEEPLGLFECPRCEHRFTVSVSPTEVSPHWPTPVRVRSRAAEEVASAA